MPLWCAFRAVWSTWTRGLTGKLVQSDPDQVLTRRIFIAAFEHGRQDLHEAMARAVDGAMIWGGQDAVLQVRALPFPHWARVAVFGPRISVAAMDSVAWANPVERETWCRRLARDVWQFDQQACSSPQVLFFERSTGQSIHEFLHSLQRAFEAENQAHPRRTIPAGLTSAICNARTAWLLANTAHRAIFPMGPDWDFTNRFRIGPSETDPRQNLDDLGSGRFDGCGDKVRWKCADVRDWAWPIRRKSEGSLCVCLRQGRRSNSEIGAHARVRFSTGRRGFNPAYNPYGSAMAFVRRTKATEH